MRWSRWLFKIPSKGKTSLLLVASVGAGLAFQSNPSLLAGDSAASYSGLRLSFDGVARSSRAIYTITFITFDYKFSLRNLPPDSGDYKVKLSEVHLRSAKRLLKLCEVNKGFYVKAGQFISSLRQFPKEYTSTLSSLQDQAIPYQFKDIREVITSNLGEDLFDLFVLFDEKPIAAASIAQVHRGLLKDNQEVAIKVQYPRLEQQMMIDITAMTVISKFVSWIFPDYRFEQIVSEFERGMYLELDFVQEAKNAERTAKNFSKSSIIRIPRVFWDLTTKQVLTMQFCSGYKVDELDYLKKSGINPTKVAKALMELFAEMIFVHGFVHGDPHPGNILVSPKGHKGFSLVLLDHGIYRELDERFRLDYCQLWKALILLDSQEIGRLGERFGVGKFSKYFPVIFTGRTIESKSAIGTQMSNEERKRLKNELQSLKMEDISSFMESLPPDFLSIIRADGLLRSVLSKLGAPHRIRLLAYAKYAVYGLTTRSNGDSGSIVRHPVSKISAYVSYLQLRVLIEVLEIVSQIEGLRSLIMKKLKGIMEELIFFARGIAFLA